MLSSFSMFFNEKKYANIFYFWEIIMKHYQNKKHTEGNVNNQKIKSLAPVFSLYILCEEISFFVFGKKERNYRSKSCLSKTRILKTQWRRVRPNLFSSPSNTNTLIFIQQKKYIYEKLKIYKNIKNYTFLFMIIFPFGY